MLKVSTRVQALKTFGGEEERRDLCLKRSASRAVSLYEKEGKCAALRFLSILVWASEYVEFDPVR